MPKKNQKRFKAQPVDSLATFLGRVEDLINNWAPERDFYPWFRGQGNSNWSLFPKLYRPENRKILAYADSFRRDFQLRAWPYLSGDALVPSSDWEWYFLMQHYGLPTRLLDWTESALVALYFALNDPEDKANPVVWVINPYWLNDKIARKGDGVLISTDSKIKQYLPKPFSKKQPPKNPIALRSPFKSNRITAQQGVFTLYGSTSKDLQHYSLLKKYLVKIEILRSKVPLMKEQLRVAGIATTSVFPELEGLCSEVQAYYRYEHGIK